MVQRRRFGIDFGSLRPADYDAVLRLPSIGFGWEFLRRNTAFQEDWEAWQSKETASVETVKDIVVRTLLARSPRAEQWGLVSYPFR